MAILFAGTQGLLDDVEVSDLRAFEDGFYKYLDGQSDSVLGAIASKKALDDDLRGRLKSAILDYKSSFLADKKKGAAETKQPVPKEVRDGATAKA